MIAVFFASVVFYCLGVVVSFMIDGVKKPSDYGEGYRLHLAAASACGIMAAGALVSFALQRLAQ